ncbi:unnamed protein product [Ranitomeya imitator]|uniref:Major facilitator superfamily (MFS) profile domain-containing protein n=1 Tax=Ranitomeya imitator TaxID=111125 RepID=A0ABN9MPQ4_9NEOB|nr:unnamed protein product [Ranitomeya imitator]
MKTNLLPELEELRQFKKGYSKRALKVNLEIIGQSGGLVGIGEASYSTIAPTIIGDLFTKNTRTLMLSVFYFAIPLGSGLGYITGSSVKQVAGDWRWALRVSPVLGMITGTLILIFVPAAKRGHTEQLKARSSWFRDMKALVKNRSYVFSSLATSTVSFATGALGMWIPLYLYRAQVVQKTVEPCNFGPCSTKDSLIFGAITCITGFLGVITGAGATKWCRLKTQRADPLVCAVGMLGSAIFICLVFVAAKSSIVAAYAKTSWKRRRMVSSPSNQNFSATKQPLLQSQKHQPRPGTEAKHLVDTTQGQKKNDASTLEKLPAQQKTN